MYKNLNFTWIISCDLGVRGGGVARAIRILRNSFVFGNSKITEINLVHVNFFRKLQFFSAAITNSEKKHTSFTPSLMCTRSFCYFSAEITIFY